MDAVAPTNNDNNNDNNDDNNDDDPFFMKEALLLIYYQLPFGSRSSPAQSLLGLNLWHAILFATGRRTSASKLPTGLS